MGVTKTPAQIKTDVQTIQTIVTPDNLIANAESIFKKQIEDLKTMLINTMDRLIELENRVTALEPVG